MLLLGIVASSTMAQDYDYQDNYGGDYQDYQGGDYQDYQGGDYQGGDPQDYQDYAGDSYQQDNLYHDYAQRQQDKAVGGGGLGMLHVAAGSALGWLVGGKVHAGRVRKKLNSKHLKEQKALYTQYYNDVYKLQEQNAELAYGVEQMKVALKQQEQKAELEALQRDYDEFKQPDIDGDDRISRAEFNMYVKNYLSNYPGLQEKDYPKFEDFDHDGDGYVSFQEYAQQMALQVQQAEMDQYYAQQKGSSSSGSAATKASSLKGLYSETKKAENFQDLYREILTK